MRELHIIFLMVLVVHVLILIVNFWMFRKYPDQLGEAMLGGGILEKKGPVWFFLFKAGLLVIWLVIFWLVMFLPIPPHRQYLSYGILLGAAFFTLVHDFAMFIQVTKSEPRIS